MYKIAVLVGSLRRESINLKLAKALAKLAKGKLQFNFLSLDLPLYNEDLWANPPPAVLKLKKDIEASDAVLFVSPEYNRSTTPIIKNAIDWGTRPWGKNSWAGKPAAIAGITPGAVGTASAQAHLRSILPTLQLALMGQPERYIVDTPGLIDAEGAVGDDTTRKFFESFLAKFEAWIARTVEKKERS